MISLSLSQWLTIFSLVVQAIILLWVSVRPQKIFRPRRALWCILLTQCLTIAGQGAILYHQFLIDPVNKFLLPPHNSYWVSRVAGDVTVVLTGWVAAALVAGLGYFVFIKKLDRRMLDERDLLLLALGTGVVGWPGVFIFLAMIFVMAVLGLILFILIRRKSVNDPLIITPYIIPAALVTILFAPWLLAATHLDKIRF